MESGQSENTADSSLFAAGRKDTSATTGTILPASTSQSLIKAPKIPRENGFGDFVFGRMLSYERCITDCPTNSRVGHYSRAEHVVHPDGSFWTDEDLLKYYCEVKYDFLRSDNAPIADLNGYERSGGFPYFKLPLEIKTKIMGLLLHPYFKNHCETEKDAIRFYVRNPESLHDLRPMFSQGLEHYVKTTEKYLWDEAGGREPEHEIYSTASFENLSQSQLAKAQTRFEVAKKHFALHERSHPTRIANYELMLNSKVDHWADWGGQSRNFLMTRLARDLSNVSPRFRQELGEFLWKRTEVIVEFEHDGQADVLAPMAFFLERPLIIKGIKYLSIPLHSTQGFNIERGIKLGTSFKNFCQYVSDVMELEHLRLDILVSWDEVKDLAERRGIFEDLEIIRQVKVSKSFKIQLRNHDFWDLGDPELLKSLTEFLLPDTLHHLESITTAGDKKSEYLAKRLLEDGA